MLTKNKLKNIKKFSVIREYPGQLPINGIIEMKSKEYVFFSDDDKCQVNGSYGLIKDMILWDNEYNKGFLLKTNNGDTIHYTITSEV